MEASTESEGTTNRKDNDGFRGRKRLNQQLSCQSLKKKKVRLNKKVFAGQETSWKCCVHFSLIMEREHPPNQTAFCLKWPCVIESLISRKSYYWCRVAPFPPLRCPPSWAHRRALPWDEVCLCLCHCPGLAQLEGSCPCSPIHLSQPDLEEKSNPLSSLCLDRQICQQGGGRCRGWGAAGTAVCRGSSSEHVDESCSGHKSARSQLSEDENRRLQLHRLKRAGEPKRNMSEKQVHRWGADTFLPRPAPGSDGLGPGLGLPGGLAGLAVGFLRWSVRLGTRVYTQRYLLFPGLLSHEASVGLV